MEESGKKLSDIVTELQSTNLDNDKDKHKHRTPYYCLLQQVCNKAQTMDKLQSHFDINVLLSSVDRQTNVDSKR